MKILITGAGGMLGYDLVNAFVNEDIIVADLPEWDITESDSLNNKIQTCRPDLIINAAAYTDVEGAEANRDLAFKVNAEGVKNLAGIASQLQVPLVHISTEYVFDGRNEKGYNEDDLTGAQNVYGQSKEQGEKHLLALCRQYYLVRTSWLFGRAPQKGKPRGKNFIDQIIELGLKQQEVRVVNDQIGRPTYAKDFALALRDLVKAKPPYGIYHLVNEGSGSWYDLAAEAFKARDLPTRLIAVPSSQFPSRAIRPQFSLLNNNKFNKLRDWRQAVKEYLT